MKAGSTPHLDPRQLIKLLKKNGFKVERTKKGWLVTGPDGRIANFHESQLRADPRTYMNTVTHLKNQVGFDLKALKR